jgi:hypothetical protein
MSSTHHHRSVFNCLFAGSLTVAFGLGTVAAGQTLYDQGFEVDTDGWFGFGGTITRVASGAGTLAVSSADGSYHAEVTIDPSTGEGAFTNFGAYRYTFPGRIIQSLDVYIDPNAGSEGDGWYLDNAVNDNFNNSAGITGGSDWREAGGVGALKATDGFWWIAADADGGAYQGPPSGGVGLKIVQADWYTIVSEWNANPDGLTVDRDTYLYNSSGAQLYSNLNPQQVPLTGAFPMGGNRYGWIAANAPTSMTLAIDNSRLAVAPEPASLAMFGIAISSSAFAFRRRRRS